MVWKIKWKSGGETATRYSNKKIAERTLKKARLKGKVVKTELTRKPRSEATVMIHERGKKPRLASKKLVWVRDKVRGGFSYRTRNVEALQKNERGRVVRFRKKRR